LQVTKQQGYTITFGEFAQLLVKHLPSLAPTQVVRFHSFSRWDASFVLLPYDNLCPGLECSAVGNAVEPTSKRYRLTDRCGFPGQNNERGLECILDVCLIAEHSAADVQYHWPVSQQDGMESNFILLRTKQLKELGVSQFPHTLVFGCPAYQLSNRAG
jgi:hypothetical protein